MARSKGAGQVKLNLSIGQPAKDRIARLQKMSGADSLSEVIRWSLAVYETLLEAKAKGSDIVIRNGNSESMLIIISPGTGEN